MLLVNTVTAAEALAFSRADPGGRLAAILVSGRFAVTGEVVPPRSADGAGVTEHARALVGYVDAANVTDNPTASAHMSPLAGVRFVAAAGVEPTRAAHGPRPEPAGASPRTCWARGRWARATSCA